MGARFLLALIFGLPVLGFGQAFNGNFETLQPNGIPTAWQLADPSGAATSNDGHLGKRCAKAWVYKNFESGLWTSTSSLSDANASEVTGYYKYLGEKNECDKATVSYLLGAKTATGGVDTLAYGDTELKLSKEYRKFELSVSAVGAGEPDFMSVQIKPKGNCNVHGQTNCCFLFVDDIILAGSTTLKAAPTEAVEEKPEKEHKPKKGKEEEAAPMEEVSDEAPAEADKIVAPVEEVPAMKEAVPADEEVAPAETPAEEAEEGGGEPLEGWESEEESSGDGGL